MHSSVSLVISVCNIFPSFDFHWCWCCHAAAGFSDWRARLKSEPALDNGFCITLYCMHRVHYTLFIWVCILKRNASSSRAPAAWKQLKRHRWRLRFFLMLPSTKQTVRGKTICIARLRNSCVGRIYWPTLGQLLFAYVLCPLKAPCMYVMK